MKDIRCLIGRHDWSSDLQDDTLPRHGAVTLVCRRCGRMNQTWDFRPGPDPPEAMGGGGGIATG